MSMVKEPRYRFQGNYTASLCSLAGRCVKKGCHTERHAKNRFLGSLKGLQIQALIVSFLYPLICCICSGNLVRKKFPIRRLKRSVTLNHDVVLLSGAFFFCEECPCRKAVMQSRVKIYVLHSQDVKMHLLSRIEQGHAWGN